MFDVGFWEFALIGVITLIIVGPEKMPAIAKKAGHYAGKIKRFIDKLKTDIDDELEVNKIKQDLDLNDQKNQIVEVFEDEKEQITDIKKDL